MPSIDSVVTSLGDVRPHTRLVAEEIASRWPVFFIWGIGSSGEHKQGRALDFMTFRLGGGVNAPGPIRVELGWEIARYLWQHRRRLGTWYVIYRQQIISINDNSYGISGEWHRMPDRGSTTANHMDHVHVSLLDNPPVYQPLQEDDVSWNDDINNYRYDADGRREKQGTRNAGEALADVEATTDFLRRQNRRIETTLAAQQAIIDKLVDMLDAGGAIDVEAIKTELRNTIRAAVESVHIEATIGEEQQ